MKRRRILWLVWLCSVICLYFFENNGGTRAVLVASFVAPLLSFTGAKLAARRIRGVLKAPESAMAGEGVNVLCRLSGNPFISICPGRCCVTCENPLTGDHAALEAPVNSQGEAVITLTSERCGTCVLTLTGVELTDWFGLWRTEAALQAEAAVLVTPELYPVSLTLDPLPDAGEDGPGGQKRFWEMEGGEIRPYVPGDPIRRMHWKLSAKMDRPLVRESPAQPYSDIALLLETALEKEDAEAVDQAVCALLSASFALADRGEEHAVLWPDDREMSLMRCDVRNEADFYRMRALLLSASTKVGGESVGALTDREDARLDASHVVLFSPHPHVSTAALSGRALTLVLPEGMTDYGADGGLRVCSLPREGAWLAL